MQRNVIQIANSTQLVSLPRKWVLKHNIKKGDSLEVEESDGKLIVSTSKIGKQEEKSLDIAINKKEEFTPKHIISPYIQGYTQLTIHYDDHQIFQMILEQLQSLIGFEVINQGSNYCVIKSISTELDKDIDNIIKRVFWSALSMMKEALEAMMSKDKQHLCNLGPLELTNNKLSYFSLRILNKEGYKKDETKTNSLYYKVWTVEEIVDDLKELCSYFTESKKKPDEFFTQVYKKVIQNFELALSLFNKFDSQSFAAIDKTIQDTLKEISELIKKSKDPFPCSLIYKINTGIGHILKEITY
jgi:phosphate uptake regulator